MSENKRLAFSWRLLKIVAVICLCGYLLMGVRADTGGLYILTLDDFETGTYINRLGGDSSTWDKTPEDDSECCTSKFVKVKKNDEKTRALKLTFKVGPKDYNGYYTKLNGVDLRPYYYLSLNIKRLKKHPEAIKIELKNTLGEKGSYHIEGLPYNKWEHLQIPLKDFVNISAFESMEELVIIFEGSRMGAAAGSVIIDDIAFTSPPSWFLKVIKKIRENGGEGNMKYRDLSMLTEEKLLDLISRKCFNYFWNEAGENTGFIKDRNTEDIPSSIAATGFGLTAICIAHHRGWITLEQAEERVKKTLSSIRDLAAGEKGFYYHFLDINTGERAWNSELSTVDTALLMGGVITAAEYFNNEEIKELAEQLYESVQWDWMMHEKKKALYMGWTPETGFDNFILWDMFGEGMIMYILGMGAPEHALPEESWHSFRRPVKDYKGNTYIYCDSESLFTYLYSHAYVDFKEKHDKYADYWKNSLTAIKSAIEFTDSHKDFYRTYREGFWGISASDGPDGYKNYGALKILFAHDGTVAPYAVCAAMPFLPEKSILTIRKLLSGYGPMVWDEEYSFVSAFNLDKEWFSTEHVGIDLGITLLMIENYRTGFVWKYFMKNDIVKRGMKKAGFKTSSRNTVTGTSGDILRDDSSPFTKEYRARSINALGKFEREDYAEFDKDSDMEYGEIMNKADLGGKFAFGWDDVYLYFTIDVTDDVVTATRTKKDLYKEDCVELYISPDSDKLIWGDESNFQIVFAPSGEEGNPIKFSFFQNEDPLYDIKFDAAEIPGGYRIEAAIKWAYLTVKPQSGKVLGVSVAVHDTDMVESAGKKINWAFVNTSSGIKLGRLILE